MPFPRDKRAIVYQRAKGVLDKRPFGTQYDVYASRYEWMHHSIAPKRAAADAFRILIGGADCQQPYSASVFNISAMSFGSLSANAIRALNKGAKMGGFARDTGEGGLSPYHREHDGDIIWEIGSGYFGCRNRDDTFSPDAFARVAESPQVKMVELKLSQHAKPGHGGVLPAAWNAAVLVVALGGNWFAPGARGNPGDSSQEFRIRRQTVASHGEVISCQQAPLSAARASRRSRSCRCLRWA